MLHKKKNKLLKAMKEEMKSLNENHIFELVKLSKGKRALKKKYGSCWKLKKIAHNQNARLDWLWKVLDRWRILIVKNINLINISSILFVFGLVVVLNLEVEQLDMKIVFSLWWLKWEYLHQVT